MDTLCLDKTGTITDGKLRVCRKIPMMEVSQSEVETLVQSYMKACEDSNATFEALKKAFPPKAVYQPVYKIPFSSKRKWGAVSLEGVGTVFVGAIEKFMDDTSEMIEEELERGRRVVAIGYVPEIWKEEEVLPRRVQMLYTVVLEDRIRQNAKKTLKFFREEGVDVKVISGDHIKTVSMIAKRAGLERWNEAVDLSLFQEEVDYDTLCKKYAVFSRVTPKQKQELVKALQRQGHKVAMTGDGVNDLLALREADCSIAVADGSDASRQIAQVVLLDSDFTHLPKVVMEGRKVVNNVTRTASVFFIKTIYSFLLSIFCLVSNMPFPFIPIQITLIDACIEAYPSFVTIVESDIRKLRKGFLKSALSNALPFALTVAGTIIWLSLFSSLPISEQQTVMYLALILISMTAVVKSCMPFNLLRGGICTTMIVGTFGTLALLPQLFEISKVTPQMAVYLMIVMAGGWMFLLIFTGMQKIIQKREIPGQSMQKIEKKHSMG